MLKGPRNVETSSFPVSRSFIINYRILCLILFARVYKLLKPVSTYNAKLIPRNQILKNVKGKAANHFKTLIITFGFK